MRVIGTVGLAGSGKGEFAAVAESLDIPVVTMGDVIRAECRNRGLDPAEHHGEIAQALREENGPAAIAEESLPHIEEALAEADTVLVDGIRSGVEVDAFEERFGEAFVLVSVEAPFELREKRIGERGRDKVDGDGENLAARDERELGFGLDEAMARADITVENTGTLEEFRSQVQEILQ
ncbi:AAA family ATPase [Natronomonas gomsonensis]|jgi:dephospho-CoA kinase|uniref:AAA family ATPase n=1 Tax=Natronomonas gomsonensis TaxID=1046043 RepID=UPI0020CA7EC4|nr:AAA family ATPase [Natronomonas gomsonensis]MCY4731386.1 AAA family ATPase [Natronomonas gomsonensis]